MKSQLSGVVVYPDKSKNNIIIFILSDNEPHRFFCRCPQNYTAKLNHIKKP